MSSAKLPSIPPGGASGLPAPEQWVTLSSQPAQAEQIQHGIERYVHSVLRNKLLVLALTVLGGGAGYFSSAFRPEAYRGRVTIELQGVNESFLNINQIDPQAGSDLYSSSQLNVQTQLQIILSDSLRRRTLARLERETVPVLDPGGGILNRARDLLGLRDEDPVSATRAATRMANATLRAAVIKNTRLIEVSCESTHPKISADFVNTLADEYIDQALEMRLKSLQKTNKWLTGQLEEVRAKLVESEERVQQHARKSGSASGGLSEARLLKLQTDLSMAQTERIEKQARFESARRASPELLGELLQDGQIRAANQKLGDLRRELADLTTTLTPAHSKVKRLQAQIDETSRLLARQTGDALDRVREDYEAAKRHEALLANAYAAQNRQVADDSDRSTTLNILKRDAEVTRQMYNALLQQVNQTSIATALPTSSARLLDGARPASAPISPVPVNNAGTGLLLGLLSGIGVVAARERWLARVFEPGHAASILNVPELGVIPSAKPAPASPARTRFAALQFGEAEPIAGELDGRRLASLHSKPSLLADSFRAALVMLLFEDRDGRRPRVITVTSPAPGEGKTTVASNLAIAIASSQRRVLLIDGDFRRPRLQTLFSLPPFDMTGLLRGESSPESVGQAISATSIPNLFVLSTTPLEENPGNLLYGPALRMLIERFRGEYYSIVIDTPPALAVPDARAWARLSDGVILVSRAGQTSEPEVRETAKLLHNDGSRIIGTILNDWRASSRLLGRYTNHYYTT